MVGKVVEKRRNEVSGFIGSEGKSGKMRGNEGKCGKGKWEK